MQINFPNEKVEDRFPIAERAIKKDKDPEQIEADSEAVISEGIELNPLLKSNAQNVAYHHKSKRPLPDSERVAEEEIEIDDAILVT